MKTRISVSPFGRVRHLFGGEHDIVKQAYNHPAQSGAAHVMNTAMVESVEAVRDNKIPAKLSVQIYDDLRWELEDPEALDDLIRTVKPIMEQVFVINGEERSFKTDIEVGPSWGELVTYKGVA